MYVGLTDYDWYTSLKDKGYDEVNFWRPGKLAFSALKPNDLFLFKLKKPYYAIVGGGFFVGYSLLPIDVAWEIFENKNGTDNKTKFYDRIFKYKNKNGMDATKQVIGCIILTDPFFFNEEDWVHPMNDWSGNIVTGKTYDISDGEGKRVYLEVMDRLHKNNNIEFMQLSDLKGRFTKYYESLTKHRIGQGAFRVIVTEAYNRRCAVSGESTLPVLQASHIKAFSDNGPNDLNNGLLLRSDIHLLFDKGYITINPNYFIKVSKYLYQNFGEDIMYRKYDNKHMKYIPEKECEKPSKEYLRWHNNKVFLG